MRSEFPKSVRRDALNRSGGLCEGTGALYGLPDGVRCNRKLSYGVHFEHVIADGLGGKPVLSNCIATCPQCNLFKAYNHDTPRIAKMKRQRDRNNGIKRRKGPPMAGSKDSGWKKKISGEVERR